MSRSDPGAATGSGNYRPAGRCYCTHSEDSHTIRSAPGRGRCCRADPKPCPCMRYVEQP